MILQLLIAWLATRIHHHQDQVIRYLLEENRILKAKCKGKRILLSDTECRRLAILAHPIARKHLTDFSTIATPDTLRRWYRRLVVQAPSPTPQGNSLGRPRVAAEIEQLVIRMATENPRWGYRRIQEALSNLGYHIHNTTVRNILRRNHIDPAPIRGRAGMSWAQFVTLHWEVLDASGGVEDLRSAVTETWTLTRKRIQSHVARCKRLAGMIQYRALAMLVLFARQGRRLWSGFLAILARGHVNDSRHSAQRSDEAFLPMRTVSHQSVAQPLQPIPLVQERSPPEAGGGAPILVGSGMDQRRSASTTRLLVASTVQNIAYNGDQSVSQSQSSGSCKNSYPAAA